MIQIKAVETQNSLLLQIGFEACCCPDCGKHVQMDEVVDQVTDDLYFVCPECDAVL